MKSKFAYFIELAIIYLILLISGIYLLKNFQFEGLSLTAYAILLSSMAFISLAVYLVVWMSDSLGRRRIAAGATGTEKSSGIVLLSAIGGKFVAYLFVILFFLIEGKNLSKEFIIAFFILYLLLTFSLIRGLLKLLNTN